jgi:hypothetical protein
MTGFPDACAREFACSRLQNGPMEQTAMTARPSSSRVPWLAWTFAVAAMIAIAVGTVARGFLGEDWFFNADNVADSLPLAMPFLVAAGVTLGVDRWSLGRTWLVVGGWLLALHGVLDVAFEVQLASIMRGGAVPAIDPWSVAQRLISGASLALGFAALAIGMWSSSVDWWRRIPSWTLVVVGVVAAATVAGLLTTNFAAAAGRSALTPEVVAIVLLGGAFVAATGALAIASLRAAPRSRPIPEVLIAAGAAIYGLNRGLAWWMFGILPPDSGLLWVTDASIADAALLAIAIGFASGALFDPAEDDRLSA